MTLCIIKAPNRSPIDTFGGIPKARSGTKLPPVAALLAVSGPATPSMAPCPNVSGSLEIFFSMEYERKLETNRSGQNTKEETYKEPE
jgi:hypothetical protein